MKRTRVFAFCSVLVLLFCLLAQPTFASTPQTIQQLSVVGAGSLTKPVTEPSGTLGPEFLISDEIGVKAQTAGLASARVANLAIPSKRMGRFRPYSLPLPEPNAFPSQVVSWQSNGFFGWDGLSHVDQRLARNGNQYSLEPPDQGLCAGNGYVVETINNAIRVFSTSGTPLTPTVALSTFFGLAPNIDRSTGVAGPFTSDPRCLFDADTKRWFLTELEEDNGQNAGATGRNYNLIAVSQTSDPTGAWTVFHLDVTDDGNNGTPNHSGCPCFGDQPLIGADRYGFYISTNEFGDAVFNGAQLYAMSKAGLAAAANGAATPVVVQLDASGALLPFGGLSYSVQPAVSPRGDYDDDNWRAFQQKGVEYFLSALQFGNPGYEVYDNRIAVWALTNTASLNSASPSVDLSFSVIRSQIYGQPDAADQKDGPIPLGTSIGEGLAQVETNDDRMNQVVYADGSIYGAVNTKLKVLGKDQTGVAWFKVDPRFEGDRLAGRVDLQGYVAVPGNNVIFPSIAVNNDGRGVITYTLVGKDYFPSVAYSKVGWYGVSRDVHIAGAGLSPEDGFSGYVAFGGEGISRWGDYSAAVSDGDSFWFASEYIPKSCATNALPCRTSLANWGTFVGTVSIW